MNIYDSMKKLERNFRKKGVKQFLISATNCSRIQNWCKIDSETKFIYSVFKYVNHLVLININENYRGKRKYAKKKNNNKNIKGHILLIFQNTFTQWFNIQMTTFTYSYYILKYWKFRTDHRRKVGILTKLLISHLLDALKLPNLALVLIPCGSVYI